MKLPATLLCAAIGIYVLGDAMLAPTPVPEHPGFIDAVLASRAVMAAVRLAIVLAGAYIVISVIALITQRRWVIRVGPVQVSEINADGRPMRDDAWATLGELDTLRQQIAHFGESLDEQSGKRKDRNERGEGSRSAGDASGSLGNVR